MSPTTSFQFSLKELKETQVPEASVAIKAALDFTSKIQTSWTKGKLYPSGEVQTYHDRIAGDFWMARVSKHTDVKYDEFKKWILLNHTDNEVKYIPLLDSFTRLEVPESLPAGWESLVVHYKFPQFFSDREMSIWLLAAEPTENEQQFVVISLPSDRPIVNSKVTRAYYCSIEVITYKADEGAVEWLMAQTSDACGNIPRWIQDKSVTSSVVEDVPHFIAWAKKQRA